MIYKTAIITIVLPSSTMVLTQGHTSRGTSSRSYMSSSVSMQPETTMSCGRIEVLKWWSMTSTRPHAANSRAVILSVSSYSLRACVCVCVCVCVIDNCTDGLIGCWCWYLSSRLVWRALTCLFLFQHTCGLCGAHMYELANQSEVHDEIPAQLWSFTHIPDGCE